MTTIPIDRGALSAIFDLARNAAKSPGTLAFIDDHASRLDMFLGALERQAKAMQQQPPADPGQPPAAQTQARAQAATLDTAKFVAAALAGQPWPPASPPPAPKEPYDPSTPQAQASRDARRARREAEAAAKQAQGQADAGGDSKSPPE